jgi:peptidyl-prolyl cis-trans isomerase B (cyclophilin B)
VIDILNPPNMLLFLSTLIISLFGSLSNEKSPVGLIETRHGDIYIQLHEETPHHRASFIQLAESGYWDSLTFDRVIPDFVAQGGCPDTEEGFNDPEYLLEPEFHDDLRHVRGAVGAGRDENPEKLSARCQFYIVQSRDGLHRLDGDYTIFGQVISGMDVVDAIVSVPKTAEGDPIDPIAMEVSIIYMTQEEIETMKDGGKIR